MSSGKRTTAVEASKTVKIAYTTIHIRHSKRLQLNNKYTHMGFPSDTRIDDPDSLIAGYISLSLYISIYINIYIYTYHSWPG